MAYLHLKGISHRDIKPSNIMIDNDGIVKIIDFGIAIHADDPRLTETQAGIGTLRYMAPEQLSTHPVQDYRLCDIYAFGICLYELCCGIPPFADTNPAGLIDQIRTDYPPDPTTFNPYIDMSLTEVLQRALLKEPVDRFQTADEMKAALINSLTVAHDKRDSNLPRGAMTDSRVIHLLRPWSRKERGKLKNKTGSPSKARYLWLAGFLFSMLLAALIVHKFSQSPDERPPLQADRPQVIQEEVVTVDPELMESTNSGELSDPHDTNRHVAAPVAETPSIQNQRNIPADDHSVDETSTIGTDSSIIPPDTLTDSAAAPNIALVLPESISLDNIRPVSFPLKFESSSKDAEVKELNFAPNDGISSVRKSKTEYDITVAYRDDFDPQGSISITCQTSSGTLVKDLPVYAKALSVSQLIDYGDTEMNNRNFQEAKKYFRAAKRVFPEDALITEKIQACDDSLSSIASAKEREVQERLAEEAQEKLREQEMEKIPAYLALAEQHYERGNERKGAEYLHKVFELDPQQSNAISISVQYPYPFGRRVAGMYDENAVSVIQARDSSYVILGTSYESKQTRMLFGNIGCDGTPIIINKSISSKSRAAAMVTNGEGSFLSVGTRDRAPDRGKDLCGVFTNEYGDIISDHYFGPKEEDIAGGVVKSRYGGFLIAGATKKTKKDDYDILMIKIDSLGREEWSQVHGSADDEIGRSVVQTKDGGYVICGLNQRMTASKTLLLKTDYIGQLKWQKTVGEENSEGIWIGETDEGQLLLVGWEKELGASKFGKDIAVIKISARGNEIWSRRLEVPGNQSPHGAILTKDRFLVIVGQSETGAEYRDDLDVFLLKLDLDGEIIWDRRYGGRGDQIGMSVIETIQGGYVIAGCSSLGSGDDMDVYIIRTDSNGEVY